MEKNQQELASENRKVTLGHDIGAGAKCLKCGPVCTGLDLHFWRKVCKVCRCSPEEHDIHTDDKEHCRRIGNLFESDEESKTKYRIQKMTIKRSDFMDEAASPNSNHAGDNRRGSSPSSDITFEWVPQGADQQTAKRYMEMLPKESQPIEGTEGAQRRNQQIHKQLPEHDQVPELCKNMSEKEQEKMLNFVKDVKEKAVGIGQVQQVLANEAPLIKSQDESGVNTAPPDGRDDQETSPPDQTGVQTDVVEGVLDDGKAGDGKKPKWNCARCKEGMGGGDVAVFAERAGQDKCWHPGCFRCQTCNELLVDLIYFFKNDDIFCGRHYADLLRNRCAACDELIFAEQFTQAEENYWHLDHFCCWLCDKQLGGQRYVSRDNHPLCLECYDQKHGKPCGTCGEKIAPGTKLLQHQGTFWHANPDCFHCSNCKTSLVGKSFLPKGKFIFCSVQCKKQLMT
ncbi:testin-like [Amphiura filiformis]|uniref:testin-like n=1 Tax=Amphiura filiformis TaxID=82378 RepID=UPI003B2118A2